MTEQKVENRFGDWIKRGFLLYRNNFLVLFVATLLAWALSAFVAAVLAGPMLAGVVMARTSIAAQLLVGYVMLGISSIGFAVLGGPLFAGLALLTLNLLDGKRPKPGIGDLFKGFQFFLNAFLFVAAWQVIHIGLHGLAPFILSPVLLPLVPLILSVSIGTLSMFGLFLIVDRKRSFRQAFLESIEMSRKRLWLYVGVFVVAGIIGMAGLIACGVGFIVTAPMYWCVVAIVYRDVVKKAAA